VYAKGEYDIADTHTIRIDRENKLKKKEEKIKLERK